MKKTKERRKEQRMHYELPVRFAEDFNAAVSQGVMVDISSRGMAFICNTDDNCPYPGQKLTTRFSIPRSGRDPSDTHSLTRTGRVYRIDTISESRRRVAMQFDEPPFWDILPRSNT
ncbi:MAG TPA: PilZ domain-containing protein [Sedimentisphaerales bacterium]|nr:PilZ domain-containing protein [Sedimentisphaerales bacterium]